MQVLLYTWPGPRLALEDLLQTSNSSPSLVGDLMLQFDARRSAQQAAAILIQLVIDRVISIKTNNPRAVRLLDLTGAVVVPAALQELLAAPWRSRERLTVRLDCVAAGGPGHACWPTILRGNHNIKLEAGSVAACGLRNPLRRRLLEAGLSTNPHLADLQLSDLQFSDWAEVRRMLEAVAGASHLVRLNLSRNNLFDSSAGDEAGRAGLRELLLSLPRLARLDLSHNLLGGRLVDLLPGLSLTFLNLTACRLTPPDFTVVLGLSSLQHLDLSENHQLAEGLRQLPDTGLQLARLELLEMEDCGLDSVSWPLLTALLARCPRLALLNLSYNTLSPVNLLSLLDRRLAWLSVVSKLECGCPAGCSCLAHYSGLLLTKFRQLGYCKQKFDKESICRRVETRNSYLAFKVALQIPPYSDH